MGKKFRITAEVVDNRQMQPGIFSLVLRAPEIAAAARCGQFVSVYSGDTARLLPRPISICETDPEKGELRLVFRIAGRGTEEFSKLTAGESVDITGPLGNGFPVERAFNADGSLKRVFLIGGGIGIPPMVGAAEAIARQAMENTQPPADGTVASEVPSSSGKNTADNVTAMPAGGTADAPGGVTAVLGYRDAQLFLADEFPKSTKVVLATEDGSLGAKGNVLDAIRENDLHADVIFACGPTPMLRALKVYAESTGTECWLSLEEKMACGIGACLSCVCQSAEADGHSNVKNKRVCTEGPVFLSTDVVL